MSKAYKSITAFEILNFWIITLIVSAVFNYIKLTLLYHAPFSSFAAAVTNFIATDGLMYAPVLFSLLIAYAVNRKTQLEIQLKRLRTTYIVAFLIIYAAVICWIYFSLYTSQALFYQKLAIVYMINYSITAFCYLLANVIFWILVKRRIRKWNVNLSGENEEILDR